MRLSLLFFPKWAVSPLLLFPLKWSFAAFLGFVLGSLLNLVSSF